MGHLEGPTGVKEGGFLFTPEVGVCVPYWEAAGYKAIRAAAHKASEGQWHRGHGIYWRSGGRQEENARSDLDFFLTPLAPKVLLPLYSTSFWPWCLLTGEMENDRKANAAPIVIESI